MSLRTPLGRVRGLGSARGGTHHWWLQRLTAIALVPLTVWFLASIVALASADRLVVLMWLGTPVVAVLMILFIGTCFYHLKLGLQVVIEDYVHDGGLKMASLILNSFVCILLAVACIFAVLKIAFGG